MTALASASTCPACHAVHGQLDEFWACQAPGFDGKPHGHKLTVLRTEDGHQIRSCPVRGCTYTKTAPLPPRSPSQGDPMTAAQGRPAVPIDLMYERAAHLESLLPAQCDIGSFT